MAIRWLSENLELGKASTWIVAVTITILLLGALISQLRFDEFIDTLRTANITLLLSALVFFTGEAILSAVRIHLFARTNPGLRSAMQANAWYVVLVLLLPVRLGDLAAVLVFQRFLNQSRGAALISIVAQRLYDVIILSSLFLVVAGSVIELIPFKWSIVIGTAVIMGALIVIHYLEMFLTPVARMLHGKMRPVGSGLRHKSLRIVLQGRIWHRHQFSTKMSAQGFFLTFLKWSCTVGGITTIILAFNTQLTIPDTLIASIAYNFIAVIPVQTIGGFGIGEIGLSVLLASMELDVSTSIGIALSVRVFLVVFTLLFFTTVLGYCRFVTAKYLGN